MQCACAVDRDVADGRMVYAWRYLPDGARYARRCHLFHTTGGLAVPILMAALQLQMRALQPAWGGQRGRRTFLLSFDA